MIQGGAVSPLNDLGKGQPGNEQGLGLIEPKALSAETKQAQGESGGSDRSQSQGRSANPNPSMLPLE